MARPLPDGIGSRASWSVHPKGKAIVFVHGFKGSALGTWLEFPRLLQQMKEFAGCDLIFYGYDGARMRATNSAYWLRVFLKEVVENPSKLANQTLWVPRPLNFSYDAVVICAHSLGAVVSRQALLDAHLSKEKWVSKTRLVLFAPAHLGASILPLVYESMGALPINFRLVPTGGIMRLLLVLLVFATKLRWRVLQDLEPRCLALKKLLKDSLKAINDGNANFLIAPAVLHAANDDIVHPIRFAEDLPHEVIPGKSHTQACKPSGTFLQPVEAVKKLL